MLRARSGGPAVIGAAGGRGRKSKTRTPTLEWEYWWRHNREAFLGAEIRLRRAAARTREAALDFGEAAAFDQAADVALGRRDHRRRLAHVFPMLRRAVRSSSSVVRQRALVALGRTGTSAAAMELRRMLLEGSRAERETAILGLGLLGRREVMPVLVGILRGDEVGSTAVGGRRIGTRLRSHACVALGLLARRCELDDAAIAELVRIISNDRIEVAQSAAVALGHRRCDRAVPDLLAVLADKEKSSSVRAAVLSTLGRIGSRAAFASVVRYLRDRDGALRRSAAVAAGGVVRPQDDDVADLVRTARSDRDRGVRNFATISLGRIGGDRAISALLRLLESGRGDDRAFAAIALGRWGFDRQGHETAKVATALRKAFETARSCRVRSAIVVAAGLIGDREAVPSLIGHLEARGHLHLRRDAALALGMIGDRRATKALRRAVTDEIDVGLRGTAAIALGLVGDAEAPRILREVMNRDANVALRGVTITGLGRVGGIDVVWALGRLLADDKQPVGVRSFATGALGWLVDEDAVPAFGTLTADSNYFAWPAALHDTVRRF